MEICVPKVFLKKFASFHPEELDGITCTLRVVEGHLFGFTEDGKMLVLADYSQPQEQPEENGQDDAESGS